MNLRRFIVAAILSLTMTSQAFDWDAVYLKGKADKTREFYRLGETITYTLTADYAGQKPDKPYFITWKCEGDDGKTLSGKQLADKPVVIRTSMRTPGFLRISGNLVDEQGKQVKKPNKKYPWESNRIWFQGGVGVQPDQLQFAPEPKDFDAFWKAQKARLDKVPFKGLAKMIPQPSRSKDILVYAVSVPCAGSAPVTGYLTISKDAKPNSLPILCSYHGYGTELQTAPKWYRGGTIHFSVNAHGYELNREPSYYRDFFRKVNKSHGAYAFDKTLNSKHETAYFNGMALRVMRSLEFITTLPQWDQKNLLVTGASQGGMQCIWAAALNHKVSRVDATVPWCCDLAGQTAFGRLHGGWRVPWTPVLDYYDPIYLASRIPRTCQVDISRACIGDYVSPPSGIAILYNNLKCPKKITWRLGGSTHGYNIGGYKEDLLFQEDKGSRQK